jgi:predicted aspartyl protease
MIAAMRWLPSVAAILAVALSSTVAHAEFYRWVDDNGSANYTEGIDNVPPRYRATAVPLSLRNTPASTTAPVTPGASTPGAATVDADTLVRFVPGRHIVVDARINGGSTVKLILDTGAATTLISPRALAASGVSVARQGRTTRTRGIARDAEVEVQRVPIDSLEVGGARVSRMLVSSYDMDMQDVEGLLGQDFLGHFNVSIDPTSGVVKLTKK